jgi:hypothetical protein
LTSEIEKTLKELFADRLAQLKSTEKLSETLLFLGHAKNGERTPEIWDKAAFSHPDLAISYTLSQRLFETFQILEFMTFNTLDVTAKIARIDSALEDLAKKTNTDISGVKGAVNDLEKTVLPSVKKIVQLFDNLKETEDRRKKNGESMIV